MSLVYFKSKIYVRLHDLFKIMTMLNVKWQRGIKHKDGYPTLGLDIKDFIYPQYTPGPGGNIEQHGRKAIYVE